MSTTDDGRGDIAAPDHGRSLGTIDQFAALAVAIAEQMDTLTIQQACDVRWRAIVLADQCGVAIQRLLTARGV